MNEVTWFQFGTFLLALIALAIRHEHRISGLEARVKTAAGLTRFVARIAIKDEGTLKAIEDGFMVRESPARLNRERMRAMVAARGRPADSTIARYRELVEDLALNDDVKIMQAIHAKFTTEELERGARVHGGTIISAMSIWLQAVVEAREDGFEHFMRDVGLMD